MFETGHGDSCGALGILDRDDATQQNYRRRNTMLLQGSMTGCKSQDIRYKSSYHHNAWPLLAMNVDGLMKTVSQRLSDRRPS